MRAQKPLIMQNEPKFKKAQMNITFDKTKDYDNWTLGERGKNKANTNPIQTQFKPNTNPIQSQSKPTIFVYVSERPATTANRLIPLLQRTYRNFPRKSRKTNQTIFCASFS